MDKTNHKSNSEIDWNKYFWILSGILVIFRIFMSQHLDLTPDEAYYWEFSRRLDFSYYDHPPMVAYVISFFNLFFGNSVLSIRLPSIIGMLLASFLIFRICQVSFSNAQAGFWAVAMLNLTPAGTAIGFITTPDTPLLIFWSVGMYAFIKALNSSKYFWWIITGLSLGCGALSKYNMIFFVPSIALTILCFKRYRHLVFTGRYWIMVFLAALGTLPIIYWNANHDWISFKFQFAHGLNPANKSCWKTFGDFLVGQLGTIGLTLFPMLWYAVIKTIKKSWQENNEKLFFLSWLAFPTMLFFTMSSLNAKVEANWPQIAYISAMILVGFFITEVNSSKRAKWILLPSVILTITVLAQALFFVFSIPPRKDVSNRLHGWKQLGQIIQKADKNTGHKAIFVAQGTTLAALCAYYGKLPPDRIAEAYCSGNNRIWWKDIIIPVDKKVVYVDDNNYSLAANFSRHADKVSSETYPIKVNNRVIRTININKFEHLISPMKLIPYR